MELLKESIKKLAARHKDTIISFRRHLHAHPELSFQEHNTAHYIAARLHELNIPFKQGIAGTGIVALIEGEAKGKVIALRADMDALPIHEKNDVDYVSTVPGVMHACGHDVHTASLLGTACILNELRHQFKGTVKLIFQPGEEKLPGGASLMIEEGVLEDPKVDMIFAQHVFPSMQVGNAGFKEGMYMASTDELYLKVKGKGGHAAMPSDYINPVIIASKILTELDDLFMNADGQIQKKNIPTVLAFGKLSAEGATNVIPDEVNIEGTFRTMNEEWRKEAHKLMVSVAEKIAMKYNGRADFIVKHGYPVLINDVSANEIAKRSAENFLGSDHVQNLPLRMTAEDFAFFSHTIPSCFYRIGTGNIHRQITSGVHTPTFDIDEDALEYSSGLMAFITINALQ